MSDLSARVAQEIWQTYVVEVGRALPEGLADRLADVLLSLPGIAVVELPKPELGSQQWCATKWFVDVDNEINAAKPIWVGMVANRLSASSARQFAGTLLAAADAAEAK